MHQETLDDCLRNAGWPTEQKQDKSRTVVTDHCAQPRLRLSSSTFPGGAWERENRMRSRLIGCVVVAKKQAGASPTETLRVIGECRFVATSSAFDLAGQTAVVTGSSSGIGRAIALELAAAGAALIVHAGKSAAAADGVRQKIRSLGVAAEVMLADLAAPGAAAALVDRAWNWRGGVDVWVNNAGADVLTGDDAGRTFDDKLAALWHVDVLAAVHLSRLVGARMQARGRGVILNVGWDQAERGMAGDSGQLFAVAKGAVMAFTRSLAASLAPQVRVNCLAPGWIKTAWGHSASKYWQQRASGESLLGRWGTPEDVARVARFLVSPAADFITGQVLAVNGGLAGPSPDV
jgi:3-oxoacyl-[acyl-carrier protein] reductase